MHRLTAFLAALVGLATVGAINAPAMPADAGTAQAVTPFLFIEDTDVEVEGTTGTTTTAEFLVLLSEPAATDVTVNYMTVSGTAGGGAGTTSDYVTENGIATITAGEVATTIEVTVNGDISDEENETFQVHLSSPVGASVQDGIGVATIFDDDPPPTLNVADTNIVEGTGPNRFIVFTVTLSAPSQKIITVNYETASGVGNDAATSPGDFTAKSGTLSFTNGLTSQTVSVTVVSDSVDETDETMSLLLKPEAINAVIGDATGVGTIKDDDGPQIRVDDVIVPAEGNAGETRTATFTVRLTSQSGDTITPASSPQAITMKVVSANETATTPSDYDALPANTTLTIPAGQTSGTVSMTVNGDDVDESDEKFRITVSEPLTASGATGASISDATGSATVLDDDAEPIMRVDDVSVAEGTGGSNSVVFTISLSKPTGRAVLIGYTTEDGTATAGSDYQDATELLTFSPGESEKKVTIPIAADQTIEADETFTLMLFGGSNASIAKGTAVATIQDDDLNQGNTPALEVNDVTLPREGGPGSRGQLLFYVTLSSQLPRTVTVNYATADGSATSPADYDAVSGSLTFAPGEVTKTIPVVTHGDRAIEFNHTFKMVLSAPVNARITKVEGLGTIVDDDTGINAVDIADRATLRGLFCRRGRSCPGLLVGWDSEVPGELAVDVRSVRPPARKGGRERVARLLRVKHRVRRAGRGAYRVRFVATARNRRLLARLRRQNVRTLRITATFTNRTGGQRGATERVRLSR